MSAQPGHPISSPVPPSSANAGGVRRHHTISAASRVSRPTSKIDVAELEDPHTEQLWNDDEEVDQDWVGGIGAVGEKSSLHRQASLPTRYHRAFGGQPARQPGSITPRALNSLSAIAGQEGEEEEWERDIRGLRSEDEHALSSSDHSHQGVDHSSSSASPLSPQYSTGLPHDPSPPPVGDYAASVRRHQSLNYPNATGARRFNQGLKRAGTLQAQPVKGQIQGMTYSGPRSPSPTNAEEEYDDESVNAEEDSYFAVAAQQGQGQYPGSPIGRSSPWSTPGASNDWRGQLGGNVNSQFVQGGNGNNAAIDDVSRALSALEINQQYGGNGGGFQQPQAVHPPRFHPSHGATPQASGIRNGSTSSNTSSRAAQSAGAYVPPIGLPLPHSTGHSQRGSISEEQPSQRDRDRGFTASGTSTWDQKERILGGRASNASLHSVYQGQGQQGKMGGNGNGANIPGVPPIPPQYLNQSQMPRFGVSSPSGSSGGTQSGHSQQGSRGHGQSTSQSDSLGGAITPIDVPTLIATKGYNPAEFDTRPLFARYFVIKSYTEDDVHKSLKYEIWSSTDPGNKRLDKAFKECAGRGPIYLFFSVNASGHFCGMAEMLTSVDYTRSSTVWASDKWKGVFKVRWIYVRDIPNANLRHIRLNNTQERKPVTNSRDTQELLPEAGQEMLRIFHTHPARTSLLQDFAFYEMQALQKSQNGQGQGNPSSPTHTPMGMQSPASQTQGMSPTNASGQHPFAMTNPTALAYAAQHMGMPGLNMNMNLGMGMNPMLQMQMNMGTAFANPHAMQNVMRHPSPGPMPVGQNFMGMGGMPGF